MSIRNIYWGGVGKGGRCVRLTTLPISCAACLEIWDPQPPGSLRALSRSVMGLLYPLLLSYSFFLTHSQYPFLQPSKCQNRRPVCLSASPTLQSSLIHSYPIPCLSSPAILFTLLRHEMKQQQQQQPPQPFGSSGSNK